ncbi:MAG: hypothetical protein KJ077_00950 [Anaerolineae bacterium]|nr:hypothetical protein [Anaerolineae bacterium]GIK37249.1 MAG: hypothetical protein BroJett011_10820 [Chloroflexota bacterium]
MKLNSLNCCYQVSLPRSDDHAGELFTLAESLLADVARGVYDCTRYNVPEVEKSERRGYKGKP